MHYANGREAKNEDVVVFRPAQSQVPVVGILYNAVAGNDYCNGRIALTQPNDLYPNLRDCLHLDDALALSSATGQEYSAKV